MGDPTDPSMTRWARLLARLQESRQRRAWRRERRRGSLGAYNDGPRVSESSNFKSGFFTND